MNFFKKLFESTSPAQIETTKSNTVETMETPRPTIDQFLFTEDRHPSTLFPSGESNPAQPKSKKSILEDLKSKNYFAMGMRDGLDDHNFETMDQNIQLIACEFKEEYAYAIQQIDGLLLKIEKALDPKFQQEMPLEFREVLLEKESLEEQKRNLKQQFDLANLGEGIVEKSVQQYKAGFRKGFKQWTTENLMFKPFNSI